MLEIVPCRGTAYVLLSADSTSFLSMSSGETALFDPEFIYVRAVIRGAGNRGKTVGEYSNRLCTDSERHRPCMIPDNVEICMNSVASSNR